MSVPTKASVQIDNPLLSAGIISSLIYVTLHVAGNDLVKNEEMISTNIWVAYFKTMKEAALWVSLAVGGLIYVWIMQTRARQEEELGRLEFYKWSASLPQWRPEGDGTTGLIALGKSPSAPPVAAAAPLLAAPTATVPAGSRVLDITAAFETMAPPVLSTTDRSAEFAGIFAKSSAPSSPAAAATTQGTPSSLDMSPPPSAGAMLAMPSFPTPIGGRVISLANHPATPTAAQGGAGAAQDNTVGAHGGELGGSVISMPPVPTSQGGNHAIMAAGLPRLAHMHEMARRLGTFTSAAQKAVATPKILPKQSSSPQLLIMQPATRPANHALMKTVEECTALAGPAPSLPVGTSAKAIAKLEETEVHRLITDCYRMKGYDVMSMNSAMGSTAGVDLLVQRKGEILIVVFWDEKREVPLEKAREVLGIVVGEGATRGILVTTGEFSRQALKFCHQKGNARLELMDARGLQRLIDSASQETTSVQTTPACPRCQAKMSMVKKRRKLGRKTYAWVCEHAPKCSGSIEAGRKNAGVLVR